MQAERQARMSPCSTDRKTLARSMILYDFSMCFELYVVKFSIAVTCMLIISWASSADKDSPLTTEIVDDPSGLIISAKTEGLNTGCKWQITEWFPTGSNTHPLTINMQRIQQHKQPEYPEGWSFQRIPWAQFLLLNVLPLPLFPLTLLQKEAAFLPQSPIFSHIS